MNILALDVGKKRIGLAWCDTGVGVVLPYGVVEVVGSEAQVAAVLSLVKSERVDRIVIGLPLGLDGHENVHTTDIRAFGNALTNGGVQPVEFVDERFTSRLADAMGGSATRDEKAAMGILESYLERLKQT